MSEHSAIHLKQIEREDGRLGWEVIKTKNWLDYPVGRVLDKSQVIFVMGLQWVDVIITKR